MSQLFSTAAGTDSAVGGSAVASGSSSSLPKSSPEKRTLYVQLSGDPGLAEIETTSDATVARLVKQIIMELPSLAKVNPSAVSLHLATAVDKETDEVKGISEKPLPPRKTLDEANVGNGACIVVKVATAAAWGSVLIECKPRSYFAKLAAAMRSAKYDPATKTITLPDGVRWPDLKSSILYARFFYNALWESVLKKGIPDSTCDGAVILGSPGIGKSAFALYALYRAVMDGRTVVYHSRKGGTAVFKDGKVYKLAPGVAIGDLEELDDPNTLYISDSFPPAACEGAFVLAVTSPKKDNWSEFAKTETVRLCVLEEYKDWEMLELGNLAFRHKPGYSEAQVLELFARFGGKVRHVLTRFGDAAYLRRLETAPSALPLAALVRAMESTNSLDGATDSINLHRLLTVVPAGATSRTRNGFTPDQPAYYDFSHAELPLGVIQSFADALDDRRRAELYQFLHEAATDPSIAGFRGVLYERSIVVPLLKRGTDKLPLYRLSPAWQHVSPPDVLKSATAPSPSASATLDLRAGLPIVHYNSVDDLERVWSTHSGDAVFLPRSKQQVAVDFVLRIGGQPILANATVSESHDIKIGNQLFQRILQAVGLQTAGASTAAATASPTTAGTTAAAATPATASTTAAAATAATASTTAAAAAPAAASTTAAAAAPAAASTTAAAATATDGSEIPFLWVLPREAYGGFNTPGPLLDASGKAVANGPTAKEDVRRRLVQYKLLVEIPKVPKARASASSPALTASASPAAASASGAVKRRAKA